MYTREGVINALKQPQLIFLEMERIFHRLFLGKNGISIMDQDWDNLIIIDACRYDLFKNRGTIEGDLSSVISKGSNTPEFLKNNFEASAHEDTIYLCTTPQLASVGLINKFFKVYQLWETEWDDTLKTVHPKNVVKKAKSAYSEYPHKRLIIHFLQPHYPFIGKTGKLINHGTITGDGVISENRDAPSIWDLLKKGEIEKEIVWKAYVENFNIVQEHVKDLIIELDGKTVITSDHGNCFGERGLYGHPEKKYVEELVKVPWLEIASENRREIEDGEINRGQEINADVQQKLADLGYQ